MCTTVISRITGVSTLADMLAEHSVLPDSISCLVVHQYRHTTRLESSQHWLHCHQSSFRMFVAAAGNALCLQVLFVAARKTLHWWTCLLSTACSNTRSATLQYLEHDTQVVSSAAAEVMCIYTGNSGVLNRAPEATVSCLTTKGQRVTTYDPRWLQRLN